MIRKIISPYLPLQLKTAVYNKINHLKYGELRDRHQNPYITHLPILLGLAKIFPIERVLEFGSGEFSTVVFLDKEIFPNIKQILSFENDPIWAKKIAYLTKNDSRLTLKLVSTQISEVVSQVCKDNNDKYDLIFVDDSTSFKERVATIREVGLNCSDQSLVVIHDYEVHEYEDAAGIFKNRFKFNAFNPHTGLVWNRANVKRRKLSKLNNLFIKFATQFEPNDIQNWLKLLEKKI